MLNFGMQNRKRKTPMPKEIINLGKNIAKIIEVKGLKQRDVAHDANLDVENLRKYIKGIKGIQEMKVSTLIRICKALDIALQNY